MNNMNTVSNTPFWLSVVSCICLVCCLLLVTVAFRSKAPATLFTGVVLGVAGFILAVVSSVKALHLLKMVGQAPNLQGAKKCFFHPFAQFGICTGYCCLTALCSMDFYGLPQRLIVVTRNPACRHNPLLLFVAG